MAGRAWTGWRWSAPGRTTTTTTRRRPTGSYPAASAPLSAETHMEFETRTGHAILERYGMTETNMNTSNPYDGDRIPGSVGFPLPGVEIRIADPETGRVLPQGEVGGIEIRGPNVFKGYWNMPEKTGICHWCYFPTGAIYSIRH